MILTTIIQCFSYGMVGIILGLVVNMISTQIIEVLQISRILKMFIQMLFCAIILGSIHASILINMPNIWMNELRGVFFISTFFGVQYTMYSDIKKIVESNTRIVSDKIENIKNT